TCAARARSRAIPRCTSCCVPTTSSSASSPTATRSTRSRRSTTTIRCGRTRTGTPSRSPRRSSCRRRWPAPVTCGAGSPPAGLWRMADQFILGVDLDGVVADHTRRFRDIMAEIRGVDPETLPLDRSWDFAEWGFAPDEYATYHRVAVMEHDMFRTMELVDGA